MSTFALSRSSFMLLIMMSMLHLCVCPAVAQGCTCNYGSVDIDSPQCVCACYPTYLQPHCLYTATDMVAIGVYVNISADTFDSYNMTSTLIWGASITASDAGTAITFTFARRTVLSSITYARYSIRGDYAQQLLWDFQAKASWQTSVGIIGVYEEVVPLGTSGNVEVDNTFVIYQSADDNIVITISTVAWALAALIFTLIIACVDNLFLHNTDHEVACIQALMDEQHQQMRIVRAQRRGVPNGAVQDYHQSNGTVQDSHQSSNYQESRDGGSPQQNKAKNPLGYNTNSLDSHQSKDYHRDGGSPQQNKTKNPILGYKTTISVDPNGEMQDYRFESYSPRQSNATNQLDYKTSIAVDHS